MPRSPLILRKFDPFQMPADVVRRLAVGRDDVLKTLVSAVEENARTNGPPQHLCLVAPRGSGKTFLLRLLGITLAERTAGEPILFLHLPEEMTHVASPLAFLREIRRRLLGEGPAANAPRKREDIGGWDALSAEVDRILASRFGNRQGLLVLCLENIKDVLRAAFRDETARRKLRAWLERADGRVMLIAASSAGRFDHDANKALFAIVRNIELKPWTSDETIDFLNRVMLARDGKKLAKDDERVARAIAVFVGGNPRLATAMAEVLGDEDAMSAAQTLDALIDNLQEYYLNRVRDLTDEENRCVVSLLTDGENVSQTAVARRLGVQQSAVAQTFRKLEYDDAFLTSERLPGQKEKLYRIADRVFVHFYNVRVLYHGTERSVLSPILDFLVSAFSEAQRADQAERLMERGLRREAEVLFGTLTSLTPAVLDYRWWSGNRDFIRVVAEMLEERRPAAGGVIAGLRTLLDDPGAPLAVDLEEVPSEYADLLSALDNLVKGRCQASRKHSATIIENETEPWLKGLAWMSRYCAAELIGDRAEAERCARAAEAVAQGIGDAVLLGIALNALRYLSWVCGDRQTAERFLRQMAELEYGQSWRYFRAHALQILSEVALRRGDKVEADGLAQRALGVAEATGVPRAIARSMEQLASLVLRAQRTEEALARAESAAEFALQSREFGELCNAVEIQGDALRALGRFQEAIELSRRCMTSLPEHAGPYLRARVEVNHAWGLTAPSTPRSDLSDAEAEGFADSVLAKLDDIAEFAYLRSVALEAKLAVAKRTGRDDRKVLDIGRRLATTARIADRLDIVAWAFAQAVDALGRLEAYDELVEQATTALKAFVGFEGDVETNIHVIARRLASALRHLGRLSDIRRIVADLGTHMRQAGAAALADVSLPLAYEAGDYDLGVDLVSPMVRDANAPAQTEPVLRRADLALACIAGAGAWIRASAILTAEFWTAAAKQNAGWDIAEVVAKKEKAEGRAAAYAVFRGLWDQLWSEGPGPTIEILRQLLTNSRAVSLSAGLLGDIVGTVETDGSGEFDQEVRMLRELIGFKAADSSPEALARLDPDLSAALLSIDPDLARPLQAQAKSRKRANARKPRAARPQPRK